MAEWFLQFFPATIFRVFRALPPLLAIYPLVYVKWLGDALYYQLIDTIARPGPIVLHLLHILFTRANIHDRRLTHDLGGRVAGVVLVVDGGGDLELERIHLVLAARHVYRMNQRVSEAVILVYHVQARLLDGCREGRDLRQVLVFGLAARHVGQFLLD